MDKVKVCIAAFVCKERGKDGFVMLTPDPFVGAHSQYLLPLRSSSSITFESGRNKAEEVLTCEEGASRAFDILLVLGHYSAVLAAM
jgi:hypothetical protein